MKSGDQPLTISQAAVALNLSPHTIRSWIIQRRLSHIRLGRAIRIPGSEVERLLRDGLVPAVGHD
jgi:excisionase family DNA binding protein